MFTTDAFNCFKCAQAAIDQIPKCCELNTQVQFQKSMLLASCTLWSFRAESMQNLVPRNAFGMLFS